jgi:hypothetical protein
VNWLIGDWGLKRKGTLDIGEHETPKPEIKIRERVRSCAEGHVGDEGPVDQGFHRDSIGSPKS